MQILLCGASGFIGQHIARALQRRGHTVLACGRGRDVPANFQTDHTAEVWLHRVAGMDAVINCVGIIRETPDGNTFSALHGKAPMALFEACTQVRVPAVIQISALGTHADRPEPYFSWRYKADMFLMGLPVRGVILRPSVVYGQGDHSMSFFRMLAALPVTPLVGDGSQRLSPVWVEDLAEAVVRAAESQEVRGVVDVVGPEIMSFELLLRRLRRWMGLGQLRVFQVPMGLMEQVARVTDQVGVGAITGDELSMLRAENFAEPKPFLGIVPVTLEVGLGVATEADRWGALLGGLRDVLRASVAFVWVATGVVCLWGVTPEVRYKMLADSGFSGPVYEYFLDALCLFEIPLGLATLVGWRVQWMGGIQLLLVSSYSVFLLFTQLEWWLHPYGPLTKNIPLLGATLVMMALEKQPRNR